MLYGWAFLLISIYFSRLDLLLKLCFLGELFYADSIPLYHVLFLRAGFTFFRVHLNRIKFNFWIQVRMINFASKTEIQASYTVWKFQKPSSWIQLTKIKHIYILYLCFIAHLLYVCGNGFQTHFSVFPLQYFWIIQYGISDYVASRNRQK